jgi:hypothetical protein
MSEYQEAAALVEPHLGESDFEAQPEDRVSRAEEVLGVRVPPSYRRFLLELGSGAVGSEEIYGLVNDDFDDHRPPQMVGLTRAFRREGHISDDLVVIYNVGQGSWYALDMSRAGPDGEAPVVAFTPGLNSPDDDLLEIAPDFGTFFRDALRTDVGE